MKLKNSHYKINDHNHKNNHLMYCLNIHPGERWEENLAAIGQYALEVKKRFCPKAPFALGLRLSAHAANELLSHLKDFITFLHRHNMYVVSINGFPYGPFHGEAIKEKVYLPDWSSSLRVSYTLDLANILAGILPEGETGTISTVPAHYGKEENPRAKANLLSIASSLAKIEKKTGKQIILALEPEPDCLLDTLDSAMSYMKKLYTQNQSAARYLGICLDTCHAAVEFESPLLWLQKLRREGIQVPKIQISAALLAQIPLRRQKQNRPHNLQHIFTSFADKYYLHQTRVLSSKGKVLKFYDLPDALTSAPCGEWRVHFHVPLIWSGREISTTASFLNDEFFREARIGNKKHYEVETYSYGVLPGPKAPIVESIVSELSWTHEKLK